MSVQIYLRKDIVEFLDYKLETIPPFNNIDYFDLSKATKFKYDINKFYWILDILTNPIPNGLNSKKQEFIPLCSKILINYIGKDYKEYLSYLTKNNIIKCNNRYNEHKCLRYKIDIDNSIEFIKYNTNVLSIPDNNIKPTQSTVNIDINPLLKNEKKSEFVEVNFEGNSNLFLKKTRAYQLELGRNRKYPTFLKTMSKYFRENLKIKYREAMEYCESYIEIETKKLERKLNEGKIDNKEFDKEIKRLPNKHSQRFSSIKNLHFGKRNKSLKFNRNSTNKRIDTNLTMMAKDIRKFIVGIENMSYLDLSNSQPVLFNILLKKYYRNGNEALKSEIKKYYITTVSGNWYEELCDIFKLDSNCDDDRDEAKKIWMKIAYSENGHYRNMKNKFKKHYPKINSLIEKIKTKYYKKFSKQLQRIESVIFINEICKTLVEKKIMPYSIHDGVLVPKEHQDATYNVMIEILNKHLGSVPTISIDDKKIYHKTSTKENLMILFEKHFNN